MTKFTYAHLADLHLGSWREDKMRNLSTDAFLQAIDNCINQNVDFIIFAGDLFNTSLPSLDTLKIVTKKLKELNDKNIPLYAIAGSHDFSPSGKTMIDVLESAGLLKNVCKGKINPETKELHLNFTTDKKTGAKLTGILGRRGLLDKTYYEHLHRETLEQEPGYKIFLFHTTIGELLPKHLEIMESQPLSFLPSKFNYYAGGHIHHPTKKEFTTHQVVTYTGALFPNNFQELERYSHGGYYIIQVNDNPKNNSHNQIKNEPLIENNTSVNDNEQASKPHNLTTTTTEPDVITWTPLNTVPHHKIILKCDGKSPDIIAYEISESFKQNIQGALLTIRLEGTISNGKPSDINWKEITEQLYERGALFIMKNTVKLESETYEEISIGTNDPELIEEQLIKEHLGQQTKFNKETELHITKELLQTLNTTKREGETVTDFQKRIESDINKVLDIHVNQSHE